MAEVVCIDWMVSLVVLTFKWVWMCPNCILVEGQSTVPQCQSNTFLVGIFCVVGNTPGWKVDPLCSFNMGPGQLTIQSMHTTIIAIKSRK